MVQRVVRRPTPPSSAGSQHLPRMPRPQLQRARERRRGVSRLGRGARPIQPPLGLCSKHTARSSESGTTRARPRPEVMNLGRRGAAPTPVVVAGEDPGPLPPPRTRRAVRPPAAPVIRGDRPVNEAETLHDCSANKARRPGSQRGSRRTFRRRRHSAEHVLRSLRPKNSPPHSEHTSRAGEVRRERL